MPGNAARTGIGYIESMKTATLGGRRPGQCNFPWAAWFGRGAVELRRGRDFACRTDSMGELARRAARRLGVQIEVRIADDLNSLTITAVRSNVCQRLSARRSA